MHTHTQIHTHTHTYTHIHTNRNLVSIILNITFIKHYTSHPKWWSNDSFILITTSCFTARNLEKKSFLGLTCDVSYQFCLLEVRGVRWISLARLYWIMSGGESKHFAFRIHRFDVEPSKLKDYVFPPPDVLSSNKYECVVFNLWRKICAVRITVFFTLPQFSVFKYLNARFKWIYWEPGGCWETEISVLWSKI